MPKVLEKPPPLLDHAFSVPTTLFWSKSVPPTAVTYGDEAGKSGLNCSGLGLGLRVRVRVRVRARARVRVRARARVRVRVSPNLLEEEPAALTPTDALVSRGDEDGNAHSTRLQEGAA